MTYAVADIWPQNGKRISQTYVCPISIYRFAKSTSLFPLFPTSNFSPLDLRSPNEAAVYSYVGHYTLSKPSQFRYIKFIRLTSKLCIKLGIVRKITVPDKVHINPRYFGRKKYSIFLITSLFSNRYIYTETPFSQINRLIFYPVLQLRTTYFVRIHSSIKNKSNTLLSCFYQGRALVTFRIVVLFSGDNSHSFKSSTW